MPKINKANFEITKKDTYSRDDIIPFIRALNMELTKLDYGMVIDGEAITDENRMNWNKYRSLSVEEFEKHRVGCCWDYAMYEHYWFDKNNIPHKLFYIEGGQIQETHTFLVYQNKGKHILFEASWKIKSGIYEFNNEEELLDYYCNEFIKNYGNDYRRFVLYEYKQPKTGINANEFMSYILKTGKMIRNVGMYYESVIKPWENIDYLDYDQFAYMQTFDYKWADELEIINSLPEKDRVWFHTNFCPNNVIERFILEKDNRKIGFIEVLRLVTAKGYSKNIAYITYAIIPEHRNKGYSKYLLNLAIRIALDNKFKELQYRVSKSNKEALRAIEHSNLFKFKKEFKTEKVYYRTL